MNHDITFLGDTAVPFGVQPRLDEEAGEFLRWTVVNLEGAIAASRPHPSAVRARLYNAAYVRENFEQWGVRLASLANNHIMDCSSGLQQTLQVLDEWQIAHCGAGSDLGKAQAPVHVVHPQGHSLVFASFGWKPIGCQVATRSSPGVNPLLATDVLRTVRSIRKRWPTSRLILMMHWNYELELYPQPAHRQLAHDAIQEGADLVIGHHPHVLGGFERIGHGAVAYSLGNWYMPSGDWFGPRLHYDRASVALSFELDTLQAALHHFVISEDGTRLQYASSELAADSESLRELTPYDGFSHREYIRWFQRNRTRRRGLPIYKDFRNRWANNAKDAFVRTRHVAVQARSVLRSLIRSRAG